jgi:hypothetical protein
MARAEQRERRRGAEHVVRKLVDVLGILRRRGKGNSRVRRGVKELIDAVGVYLDDVDRKAVRIMLREGRLTHDGRALGFDDPAMDALAAALQERECGGIILRADITSASMYALLGWLVEEGPRPAAHKLAGLDLLDLSALDRSRGVRAPYGLDDLDRCFQLRVAVRATLAQLMDEVRHGHGLELTDVHQLVRSTVELLDDAGLRIVAPVFLGSPPTTPAGHIANVYLLSVACLHRFAASREELERYCLAALLHDIGLAHGTGSHDDMRLERHPEIGADILLRTAGLPGLATRVAYCHHINEGEGSFPSTVRRLRGGPVSDAVQVADWIETLTRPTPGREAVLFPDALAELIEDAAMERRHDAVHAFHDCLTPTPPGSLVRMQSGAIGVVIDVFPEVPERPLIALIRDGNGHMLSQPTLLDLREAPDAALLPSETLPRSGRLVGE